ncbi:MAG: GatB/YqeY domain-containing protein [Bacteroidales bacterium]|nr:GatB/YqeY domain-containing protein [Bacteroidales bacterium]
MGKYSEIINEDIKKAMLAKERDKLEALRALKSAFLLAKTENSEHELTDEKEIQIIQKQYKQRIDSAEMYKANNRMELAEKELNEAKYIALYMPQALSNVELENEIKTIMAEVGAQNLADLGKVMSIASKKLAGKANNKDIADKAKQLLGNQSLG